MNNAMHAHGHPLDLKQAQFSLLFDPPGFTRDLTLPLTCRMIIHYHQLSLARTPPKHCPCYKAGLDLVSDSMEENSDQYYTYTYTYTCTYVCVRVGDGVSRVQTIRIGMCIYLNGSI